MANPASLTLEEFRAHPERVIQNLNTSYDSVFLTSEGEDLAVVQKAEAYRASEEEKKFMRAVVQGLADIEQGRHISLEEARKKLGF
jgi:PHD/YefM family antitoxin component YafN of YafNO toxin-antitoxin module